MNGREKERIGWFREKEKRAWQNNIHQDCYFEHKPDSVFNL